MPTSFSSEVAIDSGRDNELHFPEREGVFSTRGLQPLIGQNGLAVTQGDTGEYMVMEVAWPGFDSEVATASSRD